MNPALHRGIRKALRTAAQLIVAGGLTAAVNSFADGLSPNAKVYVIAGWGVVIALAQNLLESAGKIPILLPTAGLVPSTGKVLGRAVGTVDTAVEVARDTVGDVTGIVQDVGGEVIGEVEGVFGQTVEEGKD